MQDDFAKREKTAEPARATPASARLGTWSTHPFCHAFVLAATIAGAFALSWQRWTDPVVDFGREVYIPWRISEGAVLYGEVDDFYGPFSHYFNAAVFKLFGPGLSVLVAVNAAIFLLIVALLYILLRRGWSGWAALAGSWIFVIVFGLSRFSDTANYNYITPYAHSTTHGMLVALTLVTLLSRWVRSPTSLCSFVAGLVAGLTFVLKPEFMLSAAILWMTALVLRKLHGGTFNVRSLAWASLGLVTPTALFTLYFSMYFEPAEAWLAASRAWANVILTTDFISAPAQLSYSGLDAWWQRIWEHALGTLTAVITIGVIALSGVVMAKARRLNVRVTVASLTLTAIALVALKINWLEAGRCFLVFALGYVAWQVRDAAKSRMRPVVNDGDRPQDIRLLLGILALTLMARMILNGRIYQYGYYQAALVGVLLVVFLVHDLPRRFAHDAGARVFVRSGALVLLAIGAAHLIYQNIGMYRTVVLPIGQGRDRFYALHPAIFPATVPLSWLVGQLRERPPGETMLVLPEGLMLNYLTRMRSPLPHIYYYSIVTENGRERRLVQQLKARPPNWVVLVPRILEEYGIEQYGARSGQGKDLLDWVRANYASIGTIHGRPMTYERDHMEVFRLLATEGTAQR
jgi:hypothetical protein